MNIGSLYIKKNRGYLRGMVMKKTTVIFLFLVCALSMIAQQKGSERFAQVANRIVGAMNNAEYNRIVQEYSAGMTAAFPLNKTTLFFQGIESQFGKVTKIDSPQVKAIDQAVILMYFERGAQDLTLYLDDQGKIKGFLFTLHALPAPAPVSDPAPSSVTSPSVSTEPKPVQPTPAPATVAPTPVPIPTNTPPKPSVPVVSDKQKTELYPPFKGTWIITADGESNQGNSQPSSLQRPYVYSFAGIDAEGSRYRNDGKANEDYVGYEKEVLAPANGTVVEVIDGVHENSPGMHNSYVLIGNTIIMQHSSREYSVLSFLKQGSIRVKVGDKVTRGQIIAQCGNSGNTMEPALRYHLQDSPYLQTAKSIKFYFERISLTKDGVKETQLLHQPKIGEVISAE
jgi:murein DD-endopeptidase MepM/ murein hydrolase activator NlpD